MIALADYLAYLSAEVIDARRRADLQAVEAARAYAADEYLRYFRAPRFTMPSVRLEIPVRIAAVDHDTEYAFAFDDGYFLAEFNRRARRLALAGGMPAPQPVEREALAVPAFVKLRDALARAAERPVRDLDAALDYARVRAAYEAVLKAALLERDDAYAKIAEPLGEAFYQALRLQYRPRRTHVNSLLVSPEATSGDSAEDARLVRLTVELEAGGLQIRRLEGGDGREEIVVDP